MGCPTLLRKWLNREKRISTREAAGLTVVEIAAKLGTSPSRVRHWERGAHPLADAFLSYCALLEQLENRMDQEDANNFLGRVYRILADERYPVRMKIWLIKVHMNSIDRSEFEQ